MRSPNQMCLLCATYNTHTPKGRFYTVGELSESGPPDVTLVMLEADRNRSGHLLAA